MRARDIVVGQTYAVLIPHQIPQGRYPDRNHPGTPEWAWWWMQGTRFRLTVTEVDTTARPALVDGLQITEGPQVETTLTDEQVDSLGLPYGEYRVRGLLYDREDRLVALPGVVPRRVLARWLRPLDGLDDHTHRDIDRYPVLGDND